MKEKRNSGMAEGTYIWAVTVVSATGLALLALLAQHLLLFLLGRSLV